MKQYCSSMAQAGDRHVLVVGGAGYVGNVLTRRLLGAGYRVRVLDALLFDHGPAIAGLAESGGFSFHRGDIRDDAAIERALDGTTDVVLLAGLVGDPVCSKYPELAAAINDVACKRVFELANEKGVDHFVFTSTCSNYGLRDSDELATEESELAPVSLYAEAKVGFEQHVLSSRDGWRTCPTLLRIATAYGISQRMRFDLTISEFTRTLAAGEELLVYDADTWRPYCHVADISAAIQLVLESPEDAVRGEVFNVGHSEENYTKRMIVEAALEQLDGSGQVSFSEGGRDPRNYRVSFDKIRDKLGFEAAMRVPTSMHSLIHSVQAGLFDDVGSRPGFYTNHHIAGIHEDSADSGG